MRAMYHARPARRATRELDGGLDGLGAGIGEKNLVEIRHIFQQALSQHARQRGNVKLDEVGQVAVKNAFQSPAQRRVIAADRKYTKPAQEIEIAHAVAVEEVLALPLLETHIVADCLEDTDQLLVEMARVH